MIEPFKIRNREIGPEKPCFVIAEAGVNHNGRMDLARQLVDAAVRAGADAVKFQTFKAEKLVMAQANKPAYQAEPGEMESQFEMIKRLELSYDQFRELFEYCQARRILFLSTPFDEESADFLDSLGMSAFKVASFDITNLPFLAHIGRKGKPVMLSTGMSYLGEVETAIRAIYNTGNRQLALFHCTSNYPAAPEDVNLRAMHTLQTAFGVVAGYSDHTRGTDIPLAAVALGASIIEKHLTLDQTLPGPDHRASLEPMQFKSLVDGIRAVQSSLGHGRKEPASGEVNTAAVTRKSLIAARDIPAGTPLAEEHVAVRRPGTGLPPTMAPYLMGRKLRADIPAGTLLSLEMFL
jgi:N-acetylneuraminate synthase/N,N'-diacetyllegionaminate synthase